MCKDGMNDGSRLFHGGFNGAGVGVTKAHQRGKAELSYRADRAVNQATPNVKIIFEWSTVECKVSLNLIALTVSGRTSKKQVSG